jgi:hypothetical protein
MRDLLFKNLTSEDKRRRIISSSEIADREGVRTAIQRHFICIVKEVQDNKLRQPLPSIYVLKERNTKEQRERFFCRIKNSVYAVNNGKLFLILFMHSLKINLTAVTDDLKTLN